MYTLILCRREAHQRAKVYRFATPDPKSAFANYYDWLEREVAVLSGRVKVNKTTRLSLMDGKKVLRSIRLQSMHKTHTP